MLQQRAQFESQTNDSFEWFSESNQRVTRIDVYGASSAVRLL